MTQRGASDNSPCPEEPDECESLMSGSEAAARGAIPSPTVTVGRECQWLMGCEM